MSSLWTKDGTETFYIPVNRAEIGRQCGGTEPTLPRYYRVTRLLDDMFGMKTQVQMLRSMNAENRKRKYKNMTDEQILTQWQRNADKACDRGHEVHDAVERFWNHVIEEPEMNEERLAECFREFRESPEITEHIGDQLEYLYHMTRAQQLVPVKMEMILFSNRYGIAGTLDALFRYEGPTTDEFQTDCLVIIDWKTSTVLEPLKFERISGTVKAYNSIAERVLGIRKDSTTDIRNKYWTNCLQVSMYRLMYHEMFLEPIQRQYGMDVGLTHMKDIHEKGKKKRKSRKTILMEEAQSDLGVDLTDALIERQMKNIPPTETPVTVTRGSEFTRHTVGKLFIVHFRETRECNTMVLPVHQFPDGHLHQALRAWKKAFG